MKIKSIPKKILQEISYVTGKYILSPEYISLVVTNKCNFKCKTCSIWQSYSDNELNEEQWDSISEKLIKNFPKDSFVEINGGEPLLKKEPVYNLIGKLKKHFKTVALNTNGSTINSEILKKLEEKHLDIIKVSFYSMDKERHNFIRGVENAFEYSKQAIELISKSKIKLEVGILLTSVNINETPKLIDFLAGINNCSIIIQPLDEIVNSENSKDWKDNYPINELWPDKESAEKFFNWLLKKERSKIKNSKENLLAIRDYYLNQKNVLQRRCFAGQRSIVIQPDGDFSLCFKGGKIGNVLEEDFIGKLKEAVEERKLIKNCKKYCRIIGCNFSRGLKELGADYFEKL